jgi:hypothetical protein
MDFRHPAPDGPPGQAEAGFFLWGHDKRSAIGKPRRPTRSYSHSMVARGVLEGTGALSPRPLTHGVVPRILKRRRHFLLTRPGLRGMVWDHCGGEVNLGRSWRFRCPI